MNEAFKNPDALCSRNFQNVKLRLDFAEFDNLAATRILRENQFRRIQAVQKRYFCQFRGSEF